MTPDSLTLVVVSAAIPAFMGLLLLTFMLQRKVYAGFGHWVAANFILSGGYIVSALRDYDVHPFISIIIGNVLVITPRFWCTRGSGFSLGNASSAVSTTFSC